MEKQKNKIKESIKKGLANFKELIKPTSIKIKKKNIEKVYDQIEKGELQPEVLTPEALRYFKKYKTEQEQAAFWKEKYTELQSAIKNKQNCEAYIKSIL